MADTVVLCYHAVSETWPADLSVTPEALESQVAGLLRRGYRGVTFADAVHDGSGRRFAVTFDDAYRSVHRRALPILDRLGVPATLFVPTAYVGGAEPMGWPGIDRWLGTEHEPELLCLGVEDLRDLRSHGWEIAAHTHTHPRLTTVSAGQLTDELERPRQLLEEWLGTPCRTLAYPYGDCSPEIAAAAGAAGYAAAATLEATRAPGDPLLWPRVGVYHGDAPWRFRLKASPPVRRSRLSRLRHPLKALR